jgi:hypothetical protein
VPDEALFFERSKGRECLVDKLRGVSELNIVKLNQVKVLDSKPGDTFVHGLFYTLCREVEIVITVAAAFRRKIVRIPRQPFEAVAKHNLTVSIIWRSVNEVDAMLQDGFMDCCDAFLKLDIPKHASKSRAPKTHH